MTETLAHGYSSESIFIESYLMNTNMTGFRWFTKGLGTLVLWIKVASALKGLKIHLITAFLIINSLVLKTAINLFITSGMYMSDNYEHISKYRLILEKLKSIKRGIVKPTG